MRIVSYVLKRLAYLVPVLLGVTLLVFIISHAIPGDPARMMAGQKASREAVENLRRSMGLDRPLYEQYLRYLAGLVQGVGVPLGILSAVRRNRPIDHLSRIFSVFGVSMPVFWLGLMLLLLFYRHLGWLPGSGRLLAGSLGTFRNALAHILLPAFCLSYVYLAIITRIVRSSMIAVMGLDFITTARANGIAEIVIISKHCLKNALIPTVTITGLSIGELLGGAILTETIFNWPGMGKYVVDSVNFLDFPAIMGFTLVVSFAYVLINLAVDVVYAFLDPQIRY